MKKLLKKNRLLHTLLELRGNPRACIYTEPMWGLSMNLCLPYASVYMIALGLNDVQVGIVTSVYMFSQTIFAFISGAVIDKLGRRKSTAIFDFLAWSIPCLIWAFSRDFWFFVIAALFNGMMKITTVSWDCLMVEDAPKDKITQLYSWVLICGNLSALFAPISSYLVARLTLVPAMRILYINAFVIMTAKILILYKFSTETCVGRIRCRESQDIPLHKMLGGYKNAVHRISHSKGTKFAIIISILVEIVSMIGTTFWQIIASRRIGVPDTLLPVFPMVKSVMAIILFFTVISKIDQYRLKKPLYGGFVSATAGYLLLISVKNTGILEYAVLFVSLFFEALGMAVLNTVRESLAAIYADPEERSVVLAILQTIVMLVSIPFGYICGVLSDISKELPFALSIALLALGALATAVFYRNKQEASSLSDVSVTEDSPV
ncbi:MFS transporter [Thermoclostridium stercorarium subsp. leptospartum DSM 9219]|uniref:MFS transporter n=1 Tax=Thermoclostridium stercorarium subsp. leptospartum DSM 9219 TaxID=1346611 RepID=A0A1B1YLD6_THEST|nr:MFS transporter [Thermoclostridium stercorarium]ANX01581.1 MFS transporter [Thermoclostridium stercorarium subsp. leptospartum DSM 9219]